MCNAWNHPKNCTCGWGGGGYHGRSVRPSQSNNYWWIPPIRHSHESYVNPNASCPVCGASVFYYQSPEGGKVFFDELGPPWPKHPCTSSQSEPKQLYSENYKRKRYSWEKDGWIPFFIASVSEIDNYLLKITDTKNNKYYVIKKSVNKLGKANIINEQSIAFIKNFSLSVLTILDIDVSFKLYTSMLEARDGIHIRQKQHSYSNKKTFMKSKNKNTKRKLQGTAKKKSNTNKKKQKKKKEKTILNPAMALAFSEAR